MCCVCNECSHGEVCANAVYRSHTSRIEKLTLHTLNKRRIDDAVETAWKIFLTFENKWRFGDVSMPANVSSCWLANVKVYVWQILVFTLEQSWALDVSWLAVRFG